MKSPTTSRKREVKVVPTIELKREWFENLLRLSREAANAALKEVDNTKYSPFWHQYFPTLQGYISSAEHYLKS